LSSEEILRSEHRHGRSKSLLGMALLAGQAVWAAGGLWVPATGIYLGIWANPSLASNQEGAIEIREGPIANGINRPFALHLHYYAWSDLSHQLDSGGAFSPDPQLPGDISQRQYGDKPLTGTLITVHQ